MIRLGYVYGNLMVNVQPKNTKLRDRARADHRGRPFRLGSTRGGRTAGRVRAGVSAARSSWDGLKVTRDAGGEAACWRQADGLRKR